MEKEIVLKVEKSDCDAYFGHIRNEVYGSYYEEGRKDWLTQLGVSYENLHSMNLGTVVVKLEIDFKKEAFLNDVLLVKTSPYDIGKKSFILEQQIINDENKLISEAKTTLVMFDRINRIGVPVIEQIRQYFTQNSYHL